VNRHKSLDELSVAFGAGAEVGIICEGDEGGFDQWVYGEWFDPLGRVTFCPQDGWQLVQKAVTELRRRGPVRVFGLVDRDNASDEAIAAQSDGSYEGFVYKLPRYDLEAYLLEPELWFKVLRRVLFRGEPKLPEGWDSIPEVSQRISDFYRDAIPVAAHNWATHSLNQAASQHPAFKTKPSFGSLRAIRDVNPEKALSDWYGPIGADQAVCEAYRQRFVFLDEHKEHAETLCKYVSGKVVLDALFHAIPRARGRVDCLSLVQRYMDPYLDGRPPPEDIAAIIKRIIERSERESSP